MVSKKFCLGLAAGCSLNTTPATHTMSYQIGKLVEIDELVECGGIGSQIAVFEFANLSL